MQINPLGEKAKEWKRIINVTTVSDTSFDQTFSVEDISKYEEIMFTLQRDSNKRTFASSVCNVRQFDGAGLYAGGSFSLYSGLMQNNGGYWINAVAVHISNTQIEIAMNAFTEPIIIRVWVR